MAKQKSKSAARRDRPDQGEAGGPPGKKQRRKVRRNNKRK